jgi:hypothetical protein
VPFGQLAAAGEPALRCTPRNGKALASQRTPKSAAQNFELHPILSVDSLGRLRYK